MFSAAASQPVIPQKPTLYSLEPHAVVLSKSGQLPPGQVSSR